jgi:hypothetical protein
VARIVVSGYLVRFPVGGNVWAHFHYVLGLHRLGHEVWFVEEAGWDEPCYDPVLNTTSSDPKPGLHVLDDLWKRFAIGGGWAYRDESGEWYGHGLGSLSELIAGSDLFLDVGGASHFPEMRYARRRAYVDMDPVFTQLGRFGGDERLHEYDALFTYGTKIGDPTSTVPTGDTEWRPLLPPVVLDVWRDETTPEALPGTRWTTVASLDGYGAFEHDGEIYGQKDVELDRFAELPRRTSATLEIAASGAPAAIENLERFGWRVVPAMEISDPWRYRAYVRGSRGELSVAKNAYVRARSGWFSDRTATYLAAGRPAIVQDTDVRDDLRSGAGFLVFSTIEEAVATLGSVEDDYLHHAAAARAFAERHLDADRLLDELLEAAGV